MIQSLFAAVFFMLVLQKQCNKPAEPGIPACVQQRIDDIKKQPLWNPPATVTEYRYEGRRVFLFSSNCCDQYNQVLDENCNYLCAPTGGITGKGDRKCTDFGDKAELIKVVWKDERKE
jgi:hypothetical protein